MCNGFMTAREMRSLDNYITGHYGEDQYPPEEDYDLADNIPVTVHPCQECNCDNCIDIYCKYNKYDGIIYEDGPPGFTDYPLECNNFNCQKPYDCKKQECEHWRK